VGGEALGILSEMSERFEWYYLGDSGQIGPLSEPQLLDLVDHAVIGRETMVWKVGMASWVAAHSVPKLASRFQPAWAPPPVSTPPPPPGTAVHTRAAIACPRDQTPLRKDSRKGIEVDWCPHCKGVWLDHGELEKLIDQDSRYHDDDNDDEGRTQGRGRRRGFLENVFDMFD
jgi:uncharacterized protein